MTSELEFTGERFTPECEREIWYEHMHRYAFAARLCKGMRVLDAASGEGYGSALLARSAAEVTGLDLSDEAVRHASQRYAELENLSFRAGDCTRLPFDDDAFDCVVSFETIEHLEAQDEMLAEFSRVLAPGGFLVLSSPDKAEYSDRQGFDNPHHVRELYRDELTDLLRSHFPEVQLLGQKLMFHSAIFSLDDLGQVELQSVDGRGDGADRRVRQNPMYFLALCARSPEHLPELTGRLWLFDDLEESVYSHYIGEIRRNMAAGGIIADRDREIEELKVRLAESSPRGGWLSRLLGTRAGGS